MDTAISLPARYQALTRLGGGGGGEVWEVQDRYTHEHLALKVLADHADWSQNDVFAAVAALNALDQFGKEAEPIKAKLREAPKGHAPHGRYESYVPRLLEPQQ